VSSNILTTDELLLTIVEKLSSLESMMNNKENEIKEFQKNNPIFHKEDLLVAQQKATRTSFELMRDEIEELGYLVSAKARKSEVEGHRE
jgi:hypothetical protein